MKKFFFVLVFIVLIDLGVLGYFLYKFESDKRSALINFENQKNLLLYDLGYVLGLFARDKILSESFPESVRNYLNELVRSDRYLKLILIADSSGNVIFSTNVAYENKNINELFSENITSLSQYETKAKDEVLILNMPISEFNKKLLYIRIEYQRR